MCMCVVCACGVCMCVVCECVCVACAWCVHMRLGTWGAQRKSWDPLVLCLPNGFWELTGHSQE